ncbi:unnamed protein product [Rotaria socialis]
MVRTNISISCIWGGNVEGIMIKNDRAAANDFDDDTKKIICIHGWLDNVNSFLPLAEKLVNDRPNYEIFAYDRAGHGFSSHLPKGCEYSMAGVIEDLRTVILHLGWDKTKFSMLGHSYGAVFGMVYAACYPEEVECIVAMDNVPSSETPPEDIFKCYRSRIDASLQYHTKPVRTLHHDLSYEALQQLTKFRRPGLTDEGAKLIVERTVRLDKDNKLSATMDEAIKVLPIYPFTDELSRSVTQAMKASIFVIFASNSDRSKYKKTLDYLKECNPNYELAIINGPHDFHLTNAKEVVDLVKRYFDKYLR